MYKKFGEFTRLTTAEIPKKPQKRKNRRADATRNRHQVKSPFSAAAYREFMEKHKALSAKIDSIKNSEKR